MNLHTAHRRKTPENMQPKTEDFAVVKRAVQLHDPVCLFANSLVIDTDKESAVRKILKMLRSSHEPEMYLKPVFLKVPGAPEYLVRQTDGIMTTANEDEIVKRAKQIREKIACIEAGTINLDYDDEILLKALQFAFTRGEALTPYPDRYSKIGYGFPFLSAFLAAGDHLSALTLLDKASRAGFWKAQVFDKINLCQKCRGNYLNFRETCSECHSIDLESENLIHHFRCAYVGPESDFRHGDQLLCPKCDRTLRHIGIDYDKPSEISHCKNCGHQSQTADMKAKCIDCQHEMDLEFVEMKNISTWSITPKGEKAAQFGLAPSRPEMASSNSDPENETVPFQVFKILVAQERQRVVSKGTESYVGILTLNEVLEKTIDQRTLGLLQFEINQVIKGYLRPFDSLTNRGFGRYLFLMSDFKKRDALLLTDVIQSNLNTLLSDNLCVGQNLVEASVKPVTEDFEVALFPAKKHTGKKANVATDLRRRRGIWTPSQLS
ncbi:MAG: hypothetical protein D6714_16035 [Bacteroidetes bacterium]|nr:MAG: hypothetical protein D6714_16035 [Bacteroidota bacterium]